MSTRNSSFISIQLILLVAGVVGVLVMLWPHLLHYPRNGDHYFIPRLAQSLVEHGRSLSDWLLMSAPRYFPDLLIEVISFSLVGSGRVGIVLSSALLVGLQWFAVSLVARRVGMGSVPSLVAGLLYCVGCVMVGTHYTSLTYIVWHTGTFSIIVICLALATVSNQRPGPLAGLGIVVLTALVTASNVLAVPILIVGMGTVSLIYLVQNYLSQNHLMRFRGWFRLMMVPAGLALAGCALGLTLYFQAMPYPISNPVDASNLNMGLIKNPLKVMKAIFDSVISLTREPAFLFALCSALLALGRLRRAPIFPMLAMVIGFWLVTSLANQGMIELGANDEQRYRIMPINGSIAVAAISITALAAQWSLVFILPIGSAIAMLWTFNVDTTTYRLRHENLVEESACLVAQVRRIASDAELLAGEFVGVSDFGSTKRYSYVSNGLLRIVAIRINSEKAYPIMQEVPLLSRKPVYALAWIDVDEEGADRKLGSMLLSEHKAIEKYGMPAARYPCNSRVVLHYPQGLDVKLPRRLRSSGA